MKPTSVTVSASSTRPSRRERERAFRALLVIEVAEAVFAARSFRSASIEVIAKRAEVAIATLYKLFGGKEELFAAVVEYHHEEFLAGLESDLSEGVSPRDRLERFVAYVFGYFERHRQAFHIYLGSTHGFTWTSARASVSMPSPGIDGWSAW